MTKFDRFVADEVKRDALEKALPLITEALEALKEQLEADHNNLGVENPQIGNSYYQQLVGARYLITKLSTLTRPREQPKNPVGRKQYTEADRAELKEKLKQQRSNT